MYDSSTLYAMNVVELKKVASTYNLPVIHNERRDDLLTRINAVIQMVTPETSVDVRKPVFPSYVTAKEDLTPELDKLAEKGLQYKFNDEDDTWHFRCKGAEDSGTMKQPMKVIIRKATEVSRGARNPRGIKAGDAIVLV